MIMYDALEYTLEIILWYTFGGLALIGLLALIQLAVEGYLNGKEKRKTPIRRSSKSGVQIAEQKTKEQREEITKAYEESSKRRTESGTKKSRVPRQAKGC